MLQKTHYRFISAVFLCLLSASSWAGKPTEFDSLAEQFSAKAVVEKFGTSPVLNDGKKWRIAFYEGGSTANYYHYLEATIRGLMKFGWLEKADLKKIQSRKKDTERLWKWLVKKSKSDYLEFLEDG